MKKITFLLLLFIGVAKAQNLNIPDPNLKNALLNYVPQIDTNFDGEISVFEAQVPQELILTNRNIVNMTGIESFIGLKKLWCNNNPITSGINLMLMFQLEEIDCSSSPTLSSSIQFLNVSGLTQLKRLYCSNNQITSLDLSAAVNLVSINAGNNMINTLLLPTSTATLVSVYVSNNQLSGDFDFTGHTGLQTLYASANNGITSVNVSGLTNLTHLGLSDNLGLLTVNAQSCSALLQLSFGGTCPALNTLNVQGCSSLNWLDCRGGNLTTLDASNLPLLTHLDCRDNELTFLSVTNLPALKLVNCRNNQINNVMGYSSSVLLETVLADNNNFPSLDLSNHTALTTVQASDNPSLSVLNIDNCTAIVNFGIKNVPSLGAGFTFNSCFSLATFTFQNGGITTFIIDAAQTPLLNNLNLDSNSNLSTLTFIGTNQIQYLNANQCSLTTLNLNNLPLLTGLWANSNELTSLDITQNPALVQLSCYDNNLTTLDASQNSNLNYLQCYANNLETLFIKNSKNEGTLNFVNNPGLRYICVDETQQSAVQAQASASVIVNSYCSFTPGGNYNTITGNVIFDLDGNGCDNNDSVNPYVKVTIENGVSQSSVFTDNQAEYKYYVGAGSFTVTPDLENLSFFQVTPISGSVTFPDDNNHVYHQDFCVTANGIHPDLEIIVEPYVPIIPGVVAMFKIVYRNKGNQVLSQTNGISFTYDDNYFNFSTASQVPTLQNFGELNWDYANLMPFESRSIMLTFQVNLPTDPNFPVNADDSFSFEASILPIVADETAEDNVFTYTELAVNSYDPNDKVCLQGDVVSPTKIGEYLYYTINFENIGTSNAINVVVKDVIDTSKFDEKTLRVLNSSHPVEAKISGNVAEFVFQNINLAPSSNGGGGGHGNILLKVKTKDSLMAGDEVTNKAEIFFDYNFPIETNTARTTFQNLSVDEYFFGNTLSIYPNPTNGILEIKAVENIKTIELFDIQGRILKTIISGEMNEVLDLTTYPTGVYIMKVNNDKGAKIEKIIKE